MADAAKPPPAAPAAPSGPDGAAAKESTGATLIKAAEHVVVESATAIVKDLGAKSAADLKVIEKGLSQEVVHETKDGFPSLSEIEETIVDGVETVAEEVVEGAELAVDAVKAHPELIAETAVAVGIGVASIVQPELIVGSVAMIGKMAADSAKKTASDIAVTASTHVVNEISKDITEDVAKDAKVEALSTKTEVTKNETKVDEEKGIVTKTETTASSQKTQVVATGIAPPSLDTSKAVTETSKDGKEVKIVLPSKSEKTTGNESPPSDAKDESKAESPAAEATPKDSEDKGTSLVVTGNGDKKVSVKISDDGTITIGTDSSSEKKEVTETPIDPKTAAQRGEEKNDEKLAKQAESGPDPAKEDSPETKISPPKSESKANEESLAKEEDSKRESPAEITTDQAKPSEAPAPPKQNEENELVSEAKESTPSEDKPAETKESKSVKVVVKAKALAPESIIDVSQTPPPASSLSPSNSEQMLSEIHRKLNKLDKKQQDKEPALSIADAHTHDSLANLHEKLDVLLEAVSTTRVPAKEEGPKLTHEDLAKIHLKLDKVQDVLSIPPSSAPATGVEHVHQKIDAIHTAILTNKKAQEDAAILASDAIEPPFGADVKDSRIDQLHRKFDTMQASLDVITSALSQKPSRAVDMDSESSESTDESVRGAEISSNAVVGETSTVTGPLETPKAASTVQSISKPDNGAVDDVVKADNPAPSGSAVAASNGDGKSPKKVAEVKAPTKHVKRSSFFGGIFG